MDWLKDFKEDLEHRRQKEAERERYQSELRRQEKLREEEEKRERRKWLQKAIAAYPERIHIVRSLLEEMQSAGLVVLREEKKKDDWRQYQYEKMWFDVTLTHITHGPSDGHATRNYFSVEMDLGGATVWSYAHHHGYERVYFLDEKGWTEELKGLLRKAYKSPHYDAPARTWLP